MGGRPKLLALRKRIEAEGIEDEIFEAVAEGLPVGKLCTKFEITSRKMFYDWKGKEGERHEKYKAARIIAGEAHAELAGEILDELDGKTLLTGPEVQAAVSRSKYQQWLAGIKDREQFGIHEPGATINLNFGELHFDALRAARPKLLAKIGRMGTHDPEVSETTIISAEDIYVTDLGTNGGDVVTYEPYYEPIEEVAAGNDGEADAQSGQIDEPISPPAATLAPELGELL